MMNLKKFITAFVVCMFISASAGQASELHGIKFSSICDAEGNELVLKGLGLKRFFFAKAFVAGFYAERDVESEDVLDDVAKRIEVSYFVKVPGKRLSRYTEHMIQKNTTEDEYEQLESRIKLMRQYFVDLKPGDRYSLTYVPEVGTKFMHNDQLMGVIQGPDFAKGLFSVWVGERPMDRRIKSQILGYEESLDPEIINIALIESN